MAWNNRFRVQTLLSNLSCWFKAIEFETTETGEQHPELNQPNLQVYKLGRQLNYSRYKNNQSKHQEKETENDGSFATGPLDYSLQD